LTCATLLPWKNFTLLRHQLSPLGTLVLPEAADVCVVCRKLFFWSLTLSRCGKGAFYRGIKSITPVCVLLLNLPWQPPQKRCLHFFARRCWMGPLPTVRNAKICSLFPGWGSPTLDWLYASTWMQLDAIHFPRRPRRLKMSFFCISPAQTGPRNPKFSLHPRTFFPFPLFQVPLRRPHLRLNVKGYCIDCRTHAHSLPFFPSRRAAEHYLFFKGIPNPPPGYIAPAGASQYTWPAIYKNLQNIDYCSDSFKQVSNRIHCMNAFTVGPQLP
jgi:hypothetical protein